MTRRTILSALGLGSLAGAEPPVKAERPSARNADALVINVDVNATEALASIDKMAEGLARLRREALLATAALADVGRAYERSIRSGRVDEHALARHLNI